MMLQTIRQNRSLQAAIALAIGFGFGFLLQRGGVTRYGIIVGQLLLRDFTVIKVMLTAVLVGMPGIYFMRGRGLIELKPKSGAVGSTVIGGLIFGVGFAVLGYCPGTLAGAAAQGSLDALLGGVPGMFVGAWIYAMLFPKLQENILNRGSFGKVTVPELLHVSPWPVVAGVSILILIVFVLLEKAGL